MKKNKQTTGQSAGAKTRSLNVFEIEERNRRFVDLHFLNGLSIGQISKLHAIEQERIAAAGGTPEPPAGKYVVRRAIRNHIKQTATDIVLGVRHDEIVARLRYENLFLHLVTIAKRKASPPKVDPKTGKVTAPGTDAANDRDAVAAIRAAAIVQQQLDRLAGIDDPRDKRKIINDQTRRGIDAIGLARKLVQEFSGDPAAQAKIRMAIAAKVADRG